MRRCSGSSRSASQSTHVARARRSARAPWRPSSRRLRKRRRRSPRPSWLHPSRPWMGRQLPLQLRNANAGASAGVRARMDEPVKRLALALIGAVALTAERADELAESLAERGGMSKEEVRVWIDEATARWRGDAVRVSERAGSTLHGALRELGLVTRDEWEELELRVAQIEHRLRLLETKPRPVPARPT